MNVQIVDGHRAVSLEDYMSFWKQTAPNLKSNYIPPQFQYSPEVMKIAIEFDDYIKKIKVIPAILSLPQVTLDIIPFDVRFVNVTFQIKHEGKEMIIGYKFDSKDSIFAIQEQIKYFFSMILN